MPLVTLEIPTHKMPLIQEFLQETGLKATGVQPGAEGYYTNANTTSRHNLPKSYFTPSRGWEYFMNELEYE